MAQSFLRQVFHGGLRASDDEGVPVESTGQTRFDSVSNVDTEQKLEDLVRWQVQ